MVFSMEGLRVQRDARILLQPPNAKPGGRLGRAEAKGKGANRVSSVTSMLFPLNGSEVGGACPKLDRRPRTGSLQMASSPPEPLVNVSAQVDLQGHLSSLSHLPPLPNRGGDPLPTAARHPLPSPSVLQPSKVAGQESSAPLPLLRAGTRQTAWR